MSTATQSTALVRADEAAVAPFDGGSPTPDDQGLVFAVVATEGEVPGDREPFDPFAIPLTNAAGEPHLLTISPWAHASFSGDQLPVGVAALRRVGSEILAIGKLWLEMPAARDTWAVLKHMGPRMMWSIGFFPIARREPSAEERKRGVRVVYTKVLPIELTPTAAPVNRSTRTLSLKGADDIARQLKALRERHAQQMELKQIIDRIRKRELLRIAEQVHERSRRM